MIAPINVYYPVETTDKVQLLHEPDCMGLQRIRRSFAEIYKLYYIRFFGYPFYP